MNSPHMQSAVWSLGEHDSSEVKGSTHNTLSTRPPRMPLVVLERMRKKFIRMKVAGYGTISRS
jgi:hypothetical protein